jgi:hypothetical protein
MCIEFGEEGAGKRIPAVTAEECVLHMPLLAAASGTGHPQGQGLLWGKGVSHKSERVWRHHQSQPSNTDKFTEYRKSLQKPRTSLSCKEESPKELVKDLIYGPHTQLFGVIQSEVHF